MDDHPVRPDLCSEFAVLCLVHGNDVSTSHTHARHEPRCRLRNCTIRRSPFIVYFLTAKGDWILSARDFTSRCVPARAETSNPTHRLTPAHQRGETYAEIRIIQINDNMFVAKTEH